MLQAYTLLHVAISLVGIASGFVVIAGMIRNQPLPGLTKLFLATTVLTSVTGYGFPPAGNGITPGQIIGALSLIVLAVALYALYKRHLSGAWRRVYILMAIIAQYFNFFVLIVQSFQKVPFLKELAPNQNEPPFLIAQVATLVVFVFLGTLAATRFKGPTAA